MVLVSESICFCTAEPDEIRIIKQKQMAQWQACYFLVVGDHLWSMSSGFEWACLWVSDLPGKSCEWGIGAVKLQHVSPYSATHPGLLKKHRPGWHKQTGLCVCHLLEVSWQHHWWHSWINWTDPEAWLVCISSILIYWNITCFFSFEEHMSQDSCIIWINQAQLYSICEMCGKRKV